MEVEAPLDMPEPPYCNITYKAEASGQLINTVTL